MMNNSNRASPFGIWEFIWWNVMKRRRAWTRKKKILRSGIWGWLNQITSTIWMMRMPISEWTPDSSHTLWIVNETFLCFRKTFGFFFLLFLVRKVRGFTEGVPTIFDFKELCESSVDQIDIWWRNWAFSQSLKNDSFDGVRGVSCCTLLVIWSNVGLIALTQTQYNHKDDTK